MRWMLVVATLMASGCSSSTDDSPDYAPSFAGIWTGTLTYTDTSTGDELENAQVDVQLNYVARNTLHLLGACVQGGPTLVAKSATEIDSVGAFQCSPLGEEGCDSVVITYNTVQGTLTGTTFGFTTSVTLVGCGVTEQISGVFANGTR